MCVFVSALLVRLFFARFSNCDDSEETMPGLHTVETGRLLNDHSSDVALHSHTHKNTESQMNNDCEENVELTPDEAIEAAGLGLYHLRKLFLCGGIFALDAMQIQILTFAEDGIRSSFDLSDTLFSVAASAVFAGMFCGSILAGRISDSRGRKFATLVATIMITTGGAIVCLSPYFALLVIGYFILGLGSGGLHPSAALFMELLPTHRRLLGLILFTSFFTTGMMFECIVAAILQDYSWRWLTAASLSPVLISMICLPLWDESPRYLILNNRGNDAARVFEKIAAMNGRSHMLPAKFSLVVPLQRVPIEQPSFISETKKLFRHGHIRSLTLILFTVWIAASLGYYGLILIVGNLKFGSLSKFASTAVITSSEYPSYVAQYVLGTYIGRKRTFVVCSALLAILFPVIQALRSTPAWLQLLFMYITRFVVTTLFDLAWVFTPEAYPTEIRSTGYGMCSAMARISGVVAPYVALPLYNIAPWGVIGAFGVVYAVTCFVSTRLPFETKGRPLSEQVDEI